MQITTEHSQSANFHQSWPQHEPTG